MPELRIRNDQYFSRTLGRPELFVVVGHTATQVQLENVGTGYVLSLLVKELRDQVASGEFTELIRTPRAAA